MGGRDIGVVSMVLTLGWGGEVRGFVGLACLTSSRSSSGLLFSAGFFCFFEQNCNNLKMAAIGRNM